MNKDTVGCVLRHLAWETGSKGINNTKDIFVIRKYVNNFAATCKQIYSFINSEDLTKIFLESLSARFDKNLQELAAIVRNRGARNWLWKEVKLQYLQDYEFILKIHNFSYEILLEAKALGMCPNYEEKRVACSNVYWPEYQTKRGFLLHIEKNIPSHLSTPFGKISFPNKKSFTPFSIADIFISHFRAEFSYCEGSYDGLEVTCPNKGKLRMLVEKDFIRLNWYELKQKVGSSNLIISCGAANKTVYRIGESCEYYKLNEVKSSLLVNTIWGMCESHRQGNDPLAIKAFVKPVKNEKKIYFKNIADIPQWAVNLAAQVKEQPWVFPKSDKEEDHYPIHKHLPLDKYQAEVFTQFNWNTSKRFLSKTEQWTINNLGVGPCLQLFSTGNPCSLIDLKIAYEKEIEHLGKGWKATSLKENPKIAYSHSEEEYFLYIKNTPGILGDWEGLRYIAEQLNIFEFVVPDVVYQDKVYHSLLWIRKDKLHEVTTALNLQIEG